MLVASTCRRLHGHQTLPARTLRGRCSSPAGAHFLLLPMTSPTDRQRSIHNIIINNITTNSINCRHIYHCNPLPPDIYRFHSLTFIDTFPTIRTTYPPLPPSVACRPTRSSFHLTAPHLLRQPARPQHAEHPSFKCMHTSPLSFSRWMRTPLLLAQAPLPGWRYPIAVFSP